MSSGRSFAAIVVCSTSCHPTFHQLISQCRTSAPRPNHKAAACLTAYLVSFRGGTRHAKAANRQSAGERENVRTSSGASAFGIVEVIAATNWPLAGIGRSVGIFLAGQGGVRIPAPLGHVPVHVEQPPDVGKLSS